jgi:archaellum component FlaC
MKIKLALISIAFLFSIAGCNQKEKRQIDLLTKENDALRHESQSKDSTINQFFLLLNEIEQNLAEVKQKQQVISKNTLQSQELKNDVREQIDQDIQTINELMDKNKKTINYLSKKLKESNLKIAEFEKMLAQTTQQIEERDAEIVQLKEKLTELNFSIETLNAKVDTLTEDNIELTHKVTKQTEVINSAWYAFGTKKELLENGIIDKTGGFLGIGKTTRMKADFDNSYFKKIDIMEVKSIDLFAKKAKLITTHPSDSYKLITADNGTVEKIEISDPNKFWSASKYLVIEVE